MENKFNEGQEVYSLSNPSVKLVVRRYVDKIYYCRIQSDPEKKELVYFERELSETAGKPDV